MICRLIAEEFSAIFLKMSLTIGHCYSTEAETIEAQPQLHSDSHSVVTGKGKVFG